MVTASRAFVCVRPATYESATEGKLLLSLFRGRLGNLENSVFALLGPDGKERLTKTGRSPGMVFKNLPYAGSHGQFPTPGLFYSTAGAEQFGTAIFAESQ